MVIKAPSSMVVINLGDEFSVIFSPAAHIDIEYKESF